MAVFHIKANDASSIDVSGTDAFAPGGEGTLIVDANAFLISESGGFAGAELNGLWTVTINGLVQALGVGGAGLLAHNSPLKLTVGSTGYIFGGSVGLSFTDSNPGATISNRGTIAGGDDGIITDRHGDFVPLSINNSGLIHGGADGILHTIGTLTLVNRGVISGNNFSIHLDDLINPVALITNSGVLDGNVLLVSGTDALKNSGTILGDVDLGDGNDTFTDFFKVGKHVKNGTVHGSIDLGGGDDHFNGGGRIEVVIDNSGADTYNLGAGNDTFLPVGGGGATGADIINGGKGKDFYNAVDATFTVLVNLDTKAHGGLAPQSAQGADIGDPGNTDTVIGFEDVQGGSGADLLIGSNGANLLNGQAGTDDLIGLGGRDTLFGGADADRFIFQKLSDSGVKASTRDLILDFTQGEDHMNLVALETSVGHAFTFIGTANFHHMAGELRQSDSGANTIVSLDANGDGKADFSIELAGHFVLQNTDFTL
jgi:hypothetical protein